jgi:hypothetical protein
MVQQQKWMVEVQQQQTWMVEVQLISDEKMYQVLSA